MSYGQEISGVVIDELNNPIPGVLVITLPDSSSTISDENGEFQISKTDQIQCTLLGYKPRTLEVSGLEFFRVVLEIDPILLKGIEVSALTIPEEIITYPGAIGYLPLSSIETSNPTIITNLLNREPGIYMHSGALNTNRITIRGIGSRSPFSTNKIRAYFEEIPLTNGSGETTIEDSDLFAIGGMEIIKGPNSSLYGSGIGGVLNIKRKTGALFSTEVSNDLTIGSFGLLKESLGFTHHSEKQDIQIMGTTFINDGYRENNEFDRNSLFGSYGMKFEKDQFRLIGYFVDQKAFIPSSISFDEFNNDPRSAAFFWNLARGFEDYTSYFTGISWTHIFNDGLSMRSTFFHGGRDNYEPRPFNILEERTFSLGLRSKLIYEIDDNTTILVGTELFSDNYEQRTYDNLYQDFPGQGSIEGPLLTELEEDRSYINLFTQVNYRFSERLRLSGGLNMNFTKYELNDIENISPADQSGEYKFDPTPSPRIAFSYDLSENNMIYSSLSYGFSPPSLEETLNPDGEINENIKPEKGQNIEVGIKGILKGIRYQFTGYRMNIKDLLVTRRTVQDQFFGINAGSTTHNGLELSMGRNLLSFNNLSVSTNIAYALSDFSFDDFVDDGNDYSGNQLTGVPMHNFNSSLDIDFLRLIYGQLDFQFVDKIPITDDNSIFANSYNLMNMNFGMRKTFFDRLSLDLSYYLSNIFDEKYASMLLINAVGFGSSQPRYYYPGLPRNYQVRFKIKYRISSN